MKKKAVLLLVILLAACSAAPDGSESSTPFVITGEVITVIPEEGTAEPLLTTQPTPFVPTELKYRVLEAFPDFFFCDPDFYPIARDDELVLARERFPQLQANPEEFQSILVHLGCSGTTFTDEQVLAIYREHKRLNAIYFEALPDSFKFQIQTGTEGQQGTVVMGTIDLQGSIDILQSEESFPSCPICLAAGTLIDTPRGPVPVEQLRVGDSVWTANEAGERVQGLILQVGRVRVPADHQVLHIRLRDGRELWASAGHPTSDGRLFADLKSGDLFDGAQIVDVEQVPYDRVSTFDILPSGATGWYWANGILIGSTLTNDR